MSTGRTRKGHRSVQHELPPAKARAAQGAGSVSEAARTLVDGGSALSEDRFESGALRGSNTRDRIFEDRYGRCRLRKRGGEGTPRTRLAHQDLRRLYVAEADCHCGDERPGRLERPQLLPPCPRGAQLNHHVLHAPAGEDAGTIAKGLDECLHVVEVGAVRSQGTGLGGRVLRLRRHL